MSLGRFFSRYARARRGSAAVEYALWLAALSPPIFAAADVGYFGFEVLQAHFASQMAVQAAEAKCAPVAVKTFPATKYCGSNGDDLNTAIFNGEHSTALGTAVTIGSSKAKEEFMCVSASGVLTDVSGTDGVIATKTTSGVTDIDTGGTDTVATMPTPADCTSVNAGDTAEPGDYVFVTVSYTFKPLFKGFSVVNLLGGNPVTITQTSYTRLE